MKKLCDLHTHSTFSDGTFTPEELIDEAIKIGLSAVALCDHNTVEGIPHFLKASENKNIEAVAGSEFSVDYNGKELHILALFIPTNYLTQISELMLESHERKEQNNIDLIQKLRANGYDIDYDTIKKHTPRGKVNRAHIGAALTQKGYTKSINEAFSTLLSSDAGFYKAPERPTVWDMLDFIHSINAVPVLAHPLLNLTPEQLQDFLPLAKQKGLVGIECKYCLYNPEEEKLCLDLADKFNLKYSGGSDFHGSIKPDINLGVGKGNLKIPYEWYLNLKNK